MIRRLWSAFWKWDGSAIPWFSIPPLAVVIVLVCVGLVGCAHGPADLVEHEERHCDGWSHTGSPPFYQWTKRREASAKPWFYVRAIDTDSACRALGAVESGPIAACAQWHPVGCIIVLPEGQ